MLGILCLVGAFASQLFIPGEGLEVFSFVPPQNKAGVSARASSLGLDVPPCVFADPTTPPFTSFTCFLD